MGEVRYLIEEDFRMGDGDMSFPFFEDEGRNGIYGYGHWNADAFAAAVNDYDDYQADAAELPEDLLGDPYLDKDVEFGWAQVINPDEPKDDWRFRILMKLPDDFAALETLTPITIIRR